jgi:aminoglycoside phosphotransferase (APT) family kinase protein
MTAGLRGYTPPPMPDVTQRDPGEVASILTRWLRAKSAQEGAAPDARIEVFDVEAPASNGFSNETILCRVRSDAAGQTSERRLVVRVAPTTHTLFLDADFSVQYRVMRTLAAGNTGVRLPRLGWFEEDTQYLGVPFFTMDHVEGLVPADHIPHTVEGWVIEGTPEQQGRMWWSGIDALASVHRTDWAALGFEWLNHPSRGRPGIEQQMSYYDSFHHWATKGATISTLDATWKWLQAHQPQEKGDIVLNWGDSRIGNIIWDDFECAAVLDWEMASLGQPEMDLGWWLYFDRQFSDGLGVPRPAGFGSHEETIDRYADVIGRPLRNLFFYEVFSGFRFAVIMVRLADLLMASNILPGDSDMGSNNLATQLLATMLELPAPS